MLIELHLLQNRCRLDWVIWITFMQKSAFKIIISSCLKSKPTQLLLLLPLGKYVCYHSRDGLSITCITWITQVHEGLLTGQFSELVWSYIILICQL